MKIIRDLNELNIISKTAVAIGKFDGIHLGHVKLLENLLSQKQSGLITTVITFDPLPEVFFGRDTAKLLLTNSEKEKILRDMGVDILVYFPMNDISASMSAECFVDDILHKKLNMSYICAGEDLRFGAGGQGNSRFLADIAERYGFTIKIIPKVYHGEREISSSYIREAIENNETALAKALLGRPYSFSGNVIDGHKIGRTLGFPTANLAIPELKIMPPNGVYLSKISTSSGAFKGISNIGVKPTIEGERRAGIETYIYDFSADLYGDFVEVMLLHFIRPEKKFTNVEELKAQVNEDVKRGRDLFRDLYESTFF